MTTILPSGGGGGASTGSSVHSHTDSAPHSDGGMDGPGRQGSGSSGGGAAVGASSPSGLELLAPRRAVSLLGQPGGFDMFASSLLQRESSGMAAAALNDLDPGAVRQTEAYKFDATPARGGGAAAGEDATAGLGFDYTAGRSDDADGDQDTTPQQAQAELGAMLHNIQQRQQQQQWQQLRDHSHPPALVSMQRVSTFGAMTPLIAADGKIDMLRGGGGGGGGDAPGSLLPLARGDSGLPTSPEGFTSAHMDESPASGGSGSSDDPLAFPSMNRGASNIQAALEELQNQEAAQSSYVGTHHGRAHHSHSHSSARMAPLIPRELSHSQQSWSEANDGDYQSEYNSQNHSQVEHADDESDMNGAGGGAGGGGNGRLEYDGSKYAYAVHISGVDAGTNMSATHSLQQHGSNGAGVGGFAPHHAYGSHGHHHIHGHGHGHGPHHPHHSHSVPPTVPPVIEEGRDGMGHTMDSAPPLLHQPMPHTMLGLDTAYLPHMQLHQQQQQQHPYGRNPSASSSSVTTLRRSSSPLVLSHPSMRHSHSPTPSVVSLANSPAGGVQRRHGSVVQSPHPHPHSHSPGASSLPAAAPYMRALGRSPSADSLQSPSAHTHTLPPPQQTHAMGRPHSYTGGSSNSSILSPGGGGDSGRELHLHPSAAQEQAQAQAARPHYPTVKTEHHPPHLLSPSHSLQAQQQQLLHQQQLQLQQLQRQQAELQQSVQRSQQQLAAAAAAAAAAASSSSSSTPAPLDPLPLFSPSYGRSFSSEPADPMAYYSDSGVMVGGLRGGASTAPSGGATPTGASSARYHRAHCPTCAGGASCDDMHLLMAGGSGASNYRVTGYASASAASSGTTTPLRGPRGTNSMGDLHHHLLMLHGQGSAAGAPVNTLLPLCPSGAAGAAGAAASASDRIGAYTREERAKRLARYKEKKQRRFWGKRVLYACRQTFAVSRKRVGGRFIKKENASCACPDVCLPGCANYRGDAAAGDGAVSSPPPPPKSHSHKKK